MGLRPGTTRASTSPRTSTSTAWGAAEITWRLDGAPYRTLRRDDVPPETWVFDRDMYLLLNLAVGGDWPGHATDDPELPATMLLDWVRVAEIRA